AAPPQKRFYRQRAHANPLADHTLRYPGTPPHGPPGNSRPETPLTAGQGAGGLWGTAGCAGQGRGTVGDWGGPEGPPCPPIPVELSPLFPHTLMLGLELRVKVAAFTGARIRALRLAQPGHYGNVACVRANAMKHLPHFFCKAQLSKMFFLFPDPHFKRTKHKWRIISPTLLAEYGYVLRPGGLVYTVTDVAELHEWMVKHFGEHPLFEEVPLDQLDTDPIVSRLATATEEGRKVQRGGHPTFPAVFRRVPDP
ncbi:TRMB methyltransferase, partial [Galbula dea]|nr:TRMB methyltransferase [Galbula dea]